MTTSFKEKSLWITLVTISIVFSIYFVFVVDAFWEAYTMTDPNFIKLPALIPSFIAAIILMVVIIAAFHVALAIAHRKEALLGDDERDTLIELKSTRISYFILVLGFWLSGLSMLWLPPLAMANILAFFFFLGEIVGFSSQLYFYRKGV